MSIYYHPDIHEVPGATSSPFALTLETSEQPLTIQAALPLPETSRGSSQAGDQGQGAEGDKDKGKGKKKKPSLEAKDAARTRKLQQRQRKQRSRPKKLILRPRMLLPPNQVRKKTLMLPRPRPST